ncbi:MAG: 2-hydroxychromene-2-carboxylate isomerase [Vannielia sp.]|uniref:2-hydroxychromene-2-carboxylate isomerase n=1 Tax=Vannielia sp. TaxID=2813045 RepID=UPI003B8BE46F
MPHIDYFFSTISPFSYLAGDRLEKIAAGAGASIAYKPVDIMALFARTGGTPPGERHENRKAYRMQELKRAAAKTGLPMTFTPAHFPTNAAPSSYALIAAQAEGGGDVGALAQGLLRAVWAEEKDIAQDDVIKACLTAAGFDPGIADRGLLAGAETYGKNLDEAVEKGAFGAPFYVVDDGALFWGHDRLDDLEAHLKG